MMFPFVKFFLWRFLPVNIAAFLCLFTSNSVAASCEQRWQKSQTPTELQQLRKHCKSADWQARSWQKTALYWQQKRQYAKAKQAYQQLISYEGKLKSKRAKQDLLQGKIEAAQALIAQGQKQAAFDDLRVILSEWQDDIFSKAKDLSTEKAKLYNQLGELALALGEYTETEVFYQQALDLRREVYGDSHLYTAYSLNNLARVYVKQSKLVEAEPLYQQALAIKSKTLGAEDLSLTTSLNNLALLYSEQGQYAKALPLYQQALTIRQQHLSAEHKDIARSFNNLGLLYLQLGDYAKAEPLLQQALAMRKKLFGEIDLSVANSLNNLALLYQQQEQADKAAPVYLQVLSIQRRLLGDDHPRLATALNNLASLYRRQGNGALAQRMHQLGLRIRSQKLGNNHPALATSLANFALLYPQESQEAEELYLKALLIAENHTMPERLWLIQHNFSHALKKQGKLGGAIFFGKQAVNTLQSLRLALQELDEELRQHFLQDKSAVYEQLADLLLSEGRLIEARQILFMLKEEAYFDFVGRDVSQDPRRTQVIFNEREQNWLQSYQNAQTGGLEALQQYIANMSADTEVAETTLAPIDDIQLPPRTALLQYLSAEQHLQILLFTPDTALQKQVFVPKAELNRQIMHFHNALQNPLKTPIKTAKALYQQLIAPVAASLEAENIDTLWLSLDNALHYLPFATLFDGEQFLVENYALATYTAAAEKTLATNTETNLRIAGLGLSQSVADFAPLPAVKTELGQIIQEDAEDKHGVLKGDIFLDEAFTRKRLQRVLDEDYNILHIASHFVFEPGTEQASFLLLGDGDKLNLASIRSAFRFDDVDLLTLSACNTAAGNTSGGQNGGREIEGFAVLAQQQGAKQVIASLWAVNDASTASFMQRFYQHNIKNGLSHSKALQATQKAFIGSRLQSEDPDAYPYYFARPYHWAAFILLKGHTEP